MQIVCVPVCCTCISFVCVEIFQFMDASEPSLKTDTELASWTNSIKSSDSTKLSLTVLSFSKRNPQHHHQKQNQLPTKLGGGAFARRIPNALTSLKLFGSQCCIHPSLDCWNKLSSNSSCANRASNVTFARPRIAPHTAACPVLANFCPFQRLISPLAKFPSNFARIRSLPNLR